MDIAGNKPFSDGNPAAWFLTLTRMLPQNREKHFFKVVKFVLTEANIAINCFFCAFCMRRNRFTSAKEVSPGLPFDTLTSHRAKKHAVHFIFHIDKSRMPCHMVRDYFAWIAFRSGGWTADI
ncbi:hypothetical protein LJC47_01170 [Desulfosarcina sp. OttesenSCG-928-B08]|nr:hypothetical protein [Desulfosarcina sp. OttesenSCG-928-B08]